MDYDKTSLPHAYARSRKLSPETAGLWMETVAEFLAPDGDPAAAPLSILDLGCGTGRFTPMLSDRFGAKVTGVEPSEKMRTQAVGNARHPDITYLPGSAEAIPCENASFDAAFLSMVLHHFRSVPDACRELWRVLRPGGCVLLRSAFRGRLSAIGFYEFFPSALAVDEARMPDLDATIATFAAAGFPLTTHRVVTQAFSKSLQENYERIKLRGISTLELISEREVQEGLEAMRKAAEAETQPRQVMEHIDFLVFQKCDKEGNDG